MAVPLFQKNTRESLSALAAVWGCWVPSLQMSRIAKAGWPQGRFVMGNNIVSSMQKILKQRVPTLRWPAINTQRQAT